MGLLSLVLMAEGKAAGFLFFFIAASSANSPAILLLDAIVPPLKYYYFKTFIKFKMLPKTLKHENVLYKREKRLMARNYLHVS
jgi:hypothetical protein